jgi:hypothetical protein
MFSLFWFWHDYQRRKSFKLMMTLSKLQEVQGTTIGPNILILSTNPMRNSLEPEVEILEVEHVEFQQHLTMPTAIENVGLEQTQR